MLTTESLGGDCAAPNPQAARFTPLQRVDASRFCSNGRRFRKRRDVGLGDPGFPAKSFATSRASQRQDLVRQIKIVETTTPTYKLFRLQCRSFTGKPSGAEICSLQ